MVFLGRKEKRERERRLLASMDAVHQQQQQQSQPQDVNKVAHYDNGIAIPTSDAVCTYLGTCLA